MEPPAEELPHQSQPRGEAAAVSLHDGVELLERTNGLASVVGGVRHGLSQRWHVAIHVDELVVVKRHELLSRVPHYHHHAQPRHSRHSPQSPGVVGDYRRLLDETQRAAVPRSSSFHLGGFVPGAVVEARDLRQRGSSARVVSVEVVVLVELVEEVVLRVAGRAAGEAVRAVGRNAVHGAPARVAHGLVRKLPEDRGEGVAPALREAYYRDVESNVLPVLRAGLRPEQGPLKRLLRELRLGEGRRLRPVEHGDYSAARVVVALAVPVVVDVHLRAGRVDDAHLEQPVLQVYALRRTPVPGRAPNDEALAGDVEVPLSQSNVGPPLAAVLAVPVLDGASRLHCAQHLNERLQGVHHVVERVLCQHCVEGALAECAHQVFRVGGLEHEVVWRRDAEVSVHLGPLTRQGIGTDHFNVHARPRVAEDAPRPAARVQDAHSARFGQRPPVRRAREQLGHTIADR
mmetsp:Transcript_41115/g.118810  ORF Transcript_41115/g.118810 Transcript_41115/m.118810 type:complete len:459 (+) Transcript_41115:429-1805(+)